MDDQLLIRRTFDLAQMGRGRVSPNPLVGAVIVKDGQIISEGYHGKYGDVHAERMAINAVEDKSMLKGATIYVNLEPCSHHGKTPPCADLIIASGFEKVVVCHGDPNELVNGKGLGKIKAAGIKVEVGVLEKEGLLLNRRFITVQTKNRPYIILKWAQSPDGFMGHPDREIRISNDVSRNLVHKWRCEEDAILVGWNTANIDNPKLTVRDWAGRNPLRVLVDRNLKASAELEMFTDEEPLLIFNTVLNQLKGSKEWIKLDNKQFLEGMLTNLSNRNISSLIVEGGQGILQALIDSNLYDEVRILQGNQELHGGVKAPSITIPRDAQTTTLSDNLVIEFLRQV